MGVEGGRSEHIKEVGIDVSNVCIKGVGEHPPNARITFGMFHLIARSSGATGSARRAVQRADSDRGAKLNGMCWILFKDVFGLEARPGAGLHALITPPLLTVTVRVWACRERLCQAIEKEPVNLRHRMVQYW